MTFVGVVVVEKLTKTLNDVTDDDVTDVNLNAFIVDVANGETKR